MRNLWKYFDPWTRNTCKCLTDIHTARLCCCDMISCLVISCDMMRYDVWYDAGESDDFAWHVNVCVHEA